MGQKTYNVMDGVRIVGRVSVPNMLQNMCELIESIRYHIKQIKTKSQDVHHDTCVFIANAFDLWNEEEEFPVWLSRIVAGEMSDMGVQA